MLKICVIDACFPLIKKSYGLAASWLIWELKKRSEIVDIKSADIIAVTCVDPRSYKVVKNIRKKYPNQKIVVGGPGALSPYTIGLYCDAVCVGDGQRFVKKISKYGFESILELPETWIKKEKKEVIVRDGFPWNCPPIESEDGAYRVWCGRGCKNKCKFCQTGWGMNYEENPNPVRLIKQIDNLKSKNLKFNYLSNDPLQHSFFEKLPGVGHGSFSFKYINKYGLPHARQIRLGIEGISERLRKSVNKPVTNNDLVDVSTWMNHNKKSLRWFLIAGLPGEKKEDWDELKDTITNWKTKCHRGVLALSFTAWQPEPATPFGIEPLNDNYWKWFLDFKKWFFDGYGWSNRINIMQPATPKSRLESSMARMGLGEIELREGGRWGPNDRIKYPYKKLRNQLSKKESII